MTSASIEADDPAIHADAARLLEAAGIELSGDAGLVVLLLSGTAAERLVRVRDAVQRRPAPLVVAALPSDASRPAMRRALRVGASGVVLDGELVKTLAPTVEAVQAGLIAAPSALRGQLAPPALSYREKQILSLVVAGYTNRQIADELFVAESTVKTHLSSAFTKLDARSRTEAAALVLDPDEGYGRSILAITRETAR